MAKYIDPTVYVISISDDVRKRLQSIRKYVVPGWIHSKLKRLYSLVIVFILACF